MSKNILITGGAGFIGSHIAEKFVNKDYNVTVIDNLSTGNISNLQKIFNKIKFYNEDIRNLNNIEKLFSNIDYVIHLAALADIVPSINETREYYDVNVTGTLNVLTACKKNNI